MDRDLRNKTSFREIKKAIQAINVSAVLDGRCSCYACSMLIIRFLSNFETISIIINGNRTEWSPILSVIIRVITDLLITSMITDRIG